MRALQRVLQHAMCVQRAAMTQRVARIPDLQQIAHKTITQSAQQYHTALYSKPALSALATHAGRASTATRTAASVLPKCTIHTSRTAAQSALRFSQQPQGACTPNPPPHHMSSLLQGQDPSSLSTPPLAPTLRSTSCGNTSRKLQPGTFSWYGA